MDPGAVCFGLFKRSPRTLVQTKQPNSGLLERGDTLLIKVHYQTLFALITGSIAFTSYPVLVTGGKVGKLLLTK